MQGARVESAVPLSLSLSLSLSFPPSFRAIQVFIIIIPLPVIVMAPESGWGLHASD